MLFFIGFNRQVIIKDLPNITKPMIIIVVAATVLNFLGNFIYYKLLKHNGVSLVSSMTSVAPLFVALLAYFAFGETLKMKQMLGIAAITGGVFLIS
jgi:drug/metabolite transporter (DMT)-like permease